MICLLYYWFQTFALVYTTVLIFNQYITLNWNGNVLFNVRTGVVLSFE